VSLVRVQPIPFFVLFYTFLVCFYHFLIVLVVNLKYKNFTMHVLT
jgi:hypothetical protein